MVYELYLSPVLHKCNVNVLMQHNFDVKVYDDLILRALLNMHKKSFMIKYKTHANLQVPTIHTNERKIS